MKAFQGLTAANLAFFWIASIAPAAAAPITFNTALPVAEEEFIFRQQIRLLRSDSDPSAADREMRAVASISVLGYGINSKLAVFGVLP